MYSCLCCFPSQGPAGRAGLPGADGLPGPPGTVLMLPVSALKLLKERAQMRIVVSLMFSPLEALYLIKPSLEASTTYVSVSSLALAVVYILHERGGSCLKFFWTLQIFCNVNLYFSIPLWCVKPHIIRLSYLKSILPCVYSGSLLVLDRKQRKTVGPSCSFSCIR